MTTGEESLGLKSRCSFFFLLLWTHSPAKDLRAKVPGWSLLGVPRAWGSPLYPPDLLTEEGRGEEKGWGETNVKRICQSQHPHPVTCGHAEGVAYHVFSSGKEGVTDWLESEWTSQNVSGGERRLERSSLDWSVRRKQSTWWTVETAVANVFPFRPSQAPT